MSSLFTAGFAGCDVDPGPGRMIEQAKSAVPQKNGLAWLMRRSGGERSSSPAWGGAHPGRGVPGGTADTQSGGAAWVVAAMPRVPAVPVVADWSENAGELSRRFGSATRAVGGRPGRLVGPEYREGRDPAADGRGRPLRPSRHAGCSGGGGSERGSRMRCGEVDGTAKSPRSADGPRPVPGKPAREDRGFPASGGAVTGRTAR